MEKLHSVIGYVTKLYQPTDIGPGGGIAETGLRDGVLGFDIDTVADGFDTLEPGDEIEMQVSFPPPTSDEDELPGQDAIVSGVRKTGRQPGDTPETAFRIDDLNSPASLEVLRDVTWKAGELLADPRENPEKFKQARAIMDFGQSMWNFGDRGIHEAKEYMREYHTGGRWPSVTSGEGSRAGWTTQNAERTSQGHETAGRGQETPQPRKAVRAGGDPEVAIPAARTGPKPTQTAKPHERAHQR